MLGERKRKGRELSRHVLELGRMPVSANEGSTSERVLDEVEEEALEGAAEEEEDADDLAEEEEETAWRRKRRRAADWTWK